LEKVYIYSPFIRESFGSDFNGVWKNHLGQGGDHWSDSWWCGA
jgi:hypothetical protein